MSPVDSMPLELVEQQIVLHEGFLADHRKNYPLRPATDAADEYLSKTDTLRDLLAELYVRRAELRRLH